MEQIKIIQNVNYVQLEHIPLEKEKDVFHVEKENILEQAGIKTKPDIGVLIMVKNQKILLFFCDI